jgi:hypothetical protein
MVQSWFLLYLNKLREKGVHLTPSQQRLLHMHSHRLQQILNKKEWNWGMWMQREGRLKEAKKSHSVALVKAWEEATGHLPRCCTCEGQEWPRCDREFGCDWVARTHDKVVFKAAIQTYHKARDAIDAAYEKEVRNAHEEYRKYKI